MKEVIFIISVWVALLRVHYAWLILDPSRSLSRDCLQIPSLICDRARKMAEPPFPTMVHSTIHNMNDFRDYKIVQYLVLHRYFSRLNNFFLSQCRLKLKLEAWIRNSKCNKFYTNMISGLKEFM